MVTQKEIAEKLGVSVSLVSRALTGNARNIGVSEETIRRIQDAAAVEGYVPSAAARILKGAPTQTIGVVVSDFEDPFFGPIIGALLREAHEHGHSLVLAGFERRRADVHDVQPLMKHGLEGVVVVGSEPVESWATPFIEAGLRLVQIGTPISSGPATVVSVDVEQGLVALLHYLSGLGHRRVGFIGTGLELHRRRYELFQQAQTALGMEVRDAWSCLSSSPPLGVRMGACLDMLTRCGAQRPTALVAASDMVALGAMSTLQAGGFSIPDDLSLAGFDDIPLARLTAPGLTTLRQPVIEMSHKAFELMLEQDNPGGWRAGITFQPELVVRGTTAPPPERSHVS